LDLHDEVAASGIVNVIGIGETPGISNLFAKWGADRLDTIESIRIRDGEYGKDSLDWLQHSVRTSMDEMTAPSVIYENGEYVTKPPRSGSELYRFPEPIGEQECFYVPFEEAVTLPRFLGKPVGTVEMKVTVSPDLMRNFDTLEMFGLTSSDPVTTRAGVTVPPVDVLISTVLGMDTPPRGGRTYSCIAVELVGTLDGERVLRRITGMMEDREDWGVDGEGYKTALPLALAAVMVAKGEIPERGVLVPEETAASRSRTRSNPPDGVPGRAPGRPGTPFRPSVPPRPRRTPRCEDSHRPSMSPGTSGPCCGTG